VKQTIVMVRNSAQNDLLLEKVDREGSCMTVAKCFAYNLLRRNVSRQSSRHVNDYIRLQTGTNVKRS
jgi:hypothetical protein